MPLESVLTSLGLKYGPDAATGFTRWWRGGELGALLRLLEPTFGPKIAHLRVQPEPLALVYEFSATGRLDEDALALALTPLCQRSRKRDPFDQPLRSRKPKTAPQQAEIPAELSNPNPGYRDCAYGAGSLLATLERGDAEIMCKVQPPVAPAGRFAKDAFTIDPGAATVTCPAGQVTALRALADGQIACFGAACRDCPLAERCTASADGRTIRVGPHEAQLVRARARQARPRVEGRLQRHPPQGRTQDRPPDAPQAWRPARPRARPDQGRRKVDAEFSLLAAAVKLARLATLGLTATGAGGATSSA